MLSSGSPLFHQRRIPRGRATAVTAMLGALVLSASLFACTVPPSDPGSPPTTVSPLPDPPSEFSVLTYNVAGLPQEVSKENPKKHLPLISPLLNAYDVVLTQEDFDWWQSAAAALDFTNYHTRLRAEATHPYRTDRHPGPAAVGINPAARPLLVGDGIGVLSRFPLTAETHHAWSKCYGDAFTGAGDCFDGSYLARRAAGDDVFASARWAVAAALSSGATTSHLAATRFWWHWQEASCPCPPDVPTPCPHGA